MTLEYACKQLLFRDPFFGLFLSGLNKRHTKKIPTLAVGRNGLGAELLINDDFWNSLTDKEQIAVLIHELYHIAFNHIMMGTDFDDHYKFNIAADLEVNCYIDNLPKEGCFVKDFNFEPRKGTAWYYTHLPQPPQRFYGVIQGSDDQQNNNGQGQGDSDSNGQGQQDQDGNEGLPRKWKTIDDHSTWKDFDSMSAAAKELVRNQIESQLKHAATEVQKTRGTMPAGLESMLDELLKQKERVFDWRAAFRRTLGTEIGTKFRKTYQRESKRFTGSPGLRMMKKIRVLVGVDTSGSISDNELVDFFSEINYICKAGASVHVIECDAEIHNEWDYKGLQNIKISGRGGTDFQPMVDYYREHKKEFTIFVLFTDGCAPVEDLNVPNNDMTWVISSHGEHKDYPGRVIYIPDTYDD